MRAVGISRCVVMMLAIGTVARGQEAGQETSERVAYPETVLVDNPNNPPDDTGFGSVAYKYRIGKYEVTQEQYAEFLNATAKSSNQGWLPQMDRYGLTRQNRDGVFTYSVRDSWKKKPAALMSWHDALRFCNWLTNGKGEGSTETGPYMFVDEWGEKTIKMPDHAALAAESKPQWVLTSENEWYKAAYFDPGKNDGAGGYWPYPAKGNNPPGANLNSNQMKDVGTHKDSPSAYGTFDQGGNVWEWNETQANGNCGVRGGSFWINDNASYMFKRTRFCSNPPWFVYDNYGFRVALLGTRKKAEPKTEE